MKTPTILRITYRNVPPAMTQRYQEAWRRLKSEASQCDVRAWVFTSRERDGFYIEFAECRKMDAPALTSALASVDEQLDAIAPPERSGMWEEWEGNGEGK